MALIKVTNWGIWLERNRSVAVFDYELERIRARIDGGSLQMPEWVKSADDFSDWIRSVEVAK